MAKAKGGKKGATRKNMAAAEIAQETETAATIPAEDAQTADMTAAGNPMIHTPEIIAAIGRELAEKDSDAAADMTTKREDLLSLAERQTIKQAKRRITLAATKAALTE